MDILNFISWIKGKRQVTSVDPARTLLPVGLKDSRRDDEYLAGAISVQDFLAQITSTAFGQISKMDAATIPVVTQNVYQSLGLTGTLDPISTGIALGTTDTFAVKNITGETKTFLIYGSVDMGVSIAGDTIMGIKLALNGVVIDSTECKAWSIGGKAGKLVTNWMIEMDDDDEVALYVANFTNTTSISFSRARLVATPV